MVSQMQNFLHDVGLFRSNERSHTASNNQGFWQCKEQIVGTDPMNGHVKTTDHRSSDSAKIVLIFLENT